MAREAPERDTSLEGARRRASTSTSAFGVSRREGHDASTYYGSRVNEGLVSSREVGEEQPLPPTMANSIISGDSRNLDLPKNCVHLVVTSPPDNGCKGWDERISRSVNTSTSCMACSPSATGCLHPGGEWLSMSPISDESRTFLSRATSMS